MNGKIRGITIELNAETKKLHEALSTVDKESRKLQTELKDVQKLLRLDGSNVTLMAQKQEVLAKSVETVKERLTALRAAQADVEQLFQTGKISDSVYRAYQREIADTEITLNRLEGQLQAASTSLDENATAAQAAAEAAAEKAQKERELAKAVETADAKIQQEQAELERDTQALGKNASEQEKLALKRESLTRQMDTQKEKVQALRERVELLSNAEGDNEQALAEQRAELARAETALSRYQQELQETEQQMSTLNRAAQGFKAFGGKAEAAGKAMLPVSAAVAGLGVAAVKTGADFDSAMSQVAATMGMTADEIRNGNESYEKLRQAAKDAGETTKFSASQGAEALNYLALAGYDADKAIQALPTVLNLAASGGLELGYASDMVTDSMSALGLETEELIGFSDELAKTSQKSNTSIEQLGEAIITVGGTAKSLKGGTIELNTALGILADNGIKGSDAGTALRQVILNLTAPTEKAAAFMEELGFSAFDADGNMKPLNETFQELNKKLEGLNDKERQNILASIFDARQLKSAEALLANCGDRFDVLSTQIANSDGAASDMADTMNENLNGQITLLISQIQGVAIKLTEILMPTIRNVVTGISEWVDKFSQLGTGTQKVILAIAGIVAVAGPLLIVIGKLSMGIGAMISLAGTIASAGAATGVLGTVLTALTGPIGIAVLAIGGLTAAGATLYKAMNESAVPAVDLFADKVIYASDGTKVLEQSISETTKTAVGSYMDLEKGATESLMALYANTGEITEENKGAFIEQCETIKDQYSQMKDMVIAKMDEQYQQEREILQQSFLDSTAFSQEKEAEILKNFNDRCYEQKAATEAAYAEINSIVANAEAEKRAITAEEAQQIQAIQQEQQLHAVKVLSDSEVEARVILDRMKSYNEAVTVEIASQTIQKAEEARAATVDQAEQKCKEEVAVAQRLKDELGVISEEEYSQMVSAAQKKRDDTVQVAQEMKEQTVQAMLEQNADLADSVNVTTGEILTKWEKFKNDTSAKWQEIKKNFSETTQTIKESTVKIFTELGQSISNKMAEIKEAIAKKCKEFADAVKNSVEAMKQAGKDLIEGLISGIKEKLSGAVDAISGVATGVVNRIKSIFSIHSPSRVFYEIGAFVVQGLADGINENGDNAVGEMEALAGKILNTGDALSTGIITKDKETNQLIYDNLYDTVMSKIDMYYQDRDKRVSLMEEGTEKNIKSVQREVKETEKATDLKIKLYQQEYKAKMQLVDDETNDILDGLQAELDAMDEMEQRKQRQQEQEEYNNKMQELYTKLQIAEEEEKQGIFEEIEKTEADRKKVLEKQALNDKKENIRQQMEEARKEAAEKKKQLQEELEQKEYILQQQRAAEVSHLNEVIKLMQEQVEKKKELEKVQTEIAKKEAEEQSKIKAAEAESQSEKVSEELTKQTTTSKIADDTQTKNTLEELKAREQNLISDINRYGTLIQGKVAAAKATEEEITKVIEEETAKRTAILSGSTGKVTEEETGQQTAVTAEQSAIQTEILKGQTEEQNSITEGQTIYRTGQWDYQTKYYGQKSEQQTKESNAEAKKQSDFLTAQLKYRTAQFAQAMQQMLALVRSFSANVRTTAYQCGQDFYNGIRSTEEDIRRYIERMARELREALESAMDYDGSGNSDIDGSHRNGLAYVPYDNYNAILHKGERVLTAAENRNYGSGNNGEKKQVDIHITQNIYSPTPNPRQEQKRAMREFKKLSLGV